MANLMGNTTMPNYVKLTATFILAVTYIAALLVAMRFYLAGLPVPSDIVFVLGSGLTFATTVIGLHTGQSAQEAINNASPPAP